MEWKKSKIMDNFQNIIQASSGSAVRGDTILCQLFVEDTALQRLGGMC